MRCEKCNKEIEKYSEFNSKDGKIICIECYEKEYDATAQEEEQSIMDVFKNGKAFNN